MSSYNSLSYLPLHFINDIKLKAIMYKHYKWTSLVNTCMTIADFIWWCLLIDGGILIPEKIAPLVVGYFVWAYAQYFIYEANYFITESSQTGVMEQIYISPTPFYIKLISQFSAGIIYWTSELLLVYIVLLLICPVYIPINFLSVIIFLITLIGIIGFALIHSGFAFIFKRSAAFAYLLVNLLIFLNGSILPLEKMPYWVQILSKTLPTTQGIEVLRNIIFHKHTLLQITLDGSLFVLIINSSLYFIIGWFVLGKCENLALEKGSIGHY